MTSLATAFVTIRPDTKDFAPTLRRDVSASAAAVGKEGGTHAGKGFSGAFKGAAGSLTRTLGPLIGVTAVAGAVGAVAKQGIAFQDTMNTLQAVSGATASQMKEVSKRATDLGNDLTLPGVSAADAGKAMLSLAKGGLSVHDAMQAAQGTLRLAGAASIDAAKAADIQSNALNTFKLKAKDAVLVSDELANTANASAVEINDVALAMQQAGAVFSSFQGPAVGTKKAMTELNTAIGLLGNVGIKSSDAGTSLKQAMLALVNPTAKTSQVMDALNIAAAGGVVKQQQLTDIVKGDKKARDSATQAIVNHNKAVKTNGDLVYTAAGKMRPFPEIINRVRDATKGMAGEQKNATIAQIFGSDATRSILALVDASPKKYAAMEKAVTRAGGAQKVAEAKSRGLGGALRGLQSQFETISLVAYQKVAPALEGGVRGVSKFIEVIQGGGGGGGVGKLGSTFNALADAGRKLLPTIKDIAHNVMATLGPGLKDIGHLIQTQLLPAFRNILPILVPVAKFLLAMFGDALVGAIKGAIQVIKGVIEVISGVFNLVADLIHGRWGKLWGDFKQILVGALNIIIGAFKVWFNVGILAIFKHGVLRLLTSWRGLWDGARDLGKKGMDLIGRLLDAAFKFIFRLFARAVREYVGFWRDLFSTIVRIAVNGWRVLRSAFGGAFTAIRTIITDAVKAYIGFWRGLFDRLLNIARGAWGTVRKLFSDALGLIRTGFSKAVDGIATIWNKLRNAAAAPVRFIVNTVYNDGIRRALNHLPFVNLPAEHANFWKGGSTGPGSKYQPAGIVHADEHVWTKEEVHKAGGHKVLAAMRASVMRGYASGGRVVWPTTGHITSTYAGHDGVDINGPGQDYGNPIFAFRAGRVTYAGAGHGYGNAVFEATSAANVVYGHMSQILARTGEILKAGQLIGRVGATGHATGPHLHFGIPGGTYAQAMALLRGASSIAGAPGGYAGPSLGGVLSALNPAHWMAHLRAMGGFGPMLADSVGSIAGKAKAFATRAIKALTPVGRALTGGAGKDAPGGAIGQQLTIMARAYGWTGSELQSLNNIVRNESGFNPNAQNPSSSAYGLFQFLNGTWGSVGARKSSNPATQIAAGLRYIQQRYGDPNAAWAYWQKHHSYDGGGVARGMGYLPKATPLPERMLSPRQTIAFEKQVAALDAGKGGDTVLKVYDADGVFQGMMRGVADERINARSGFAATRGRQ